MQLSMAEMMYNSHVKESLLSGKPVDFSLKDFQISEKRKKKKAKCCNQLKEELISKLNELKKEYGKIEDGLLRLSLFKSYVMEKMMNAKDIEEVKEIYRVYKEITWNTTI